MRTFVVDGSFFLSISIPRGDREEIFQIRTLGHGSSNMDSDAGKETFVVAPSSAGSSSKADAWREFEWKLMWVLIFPTEQSSLYILSLSWDVIYSPEAASSCWTQYQPIIDSWCDYLTRVHAMWFGGLTVLISFPPNQNESSLWYPAFQSAKPADGVSLSHQHPDMESQ